MKKEFWVTNISNMNVSLYDFNVTIKAKTSYNLLGKNSKVTEKQIIESVKNGSLFKKKDKLKVRISSPINNKEKIMLSDNMLPLKERSIFEIKEEKFAELEMTDDEFAEEHGESEELDRFRK